MAESAILGVTQEQINDWKSKFGEVWSQKLGDDQYVYRPIRRFEYKQVMNTPDSNRAFNEEKIVQMCVVYPSMDATKMPSMKAGTISTLVELIMAASNFGLSEEPVRL